MNGHEFKTIERALTSLLASTQLTIKYEDSFGHMTAKLDGRNSPYISHQNVEFDIAVYSGDASVRDILEEGYDEPSFLFSNSRFLALVMPFAPTYLDKNGEDLQLIPKNHVQGLLDESYRHLGKSREMYRCFDSNWVKIFVIEAKEEDAKE